MVRFPVWEVVVEISILSSIFSGTISRRDKVCTVKTMYFNDLSMVKSSKKRFYKGTYVKVNTKRFLPYSSGYVIIRITG